MSSVAENLDNLLTESGEMPVLLLVDDHHVTSEIERNYFSNAGFRVLVAASLAEVEQLVTHQHVDVLMIDVNFAREQGLQVMQHAKALSRNKELKAVVTSLVGLPSVRKGAMEKGADQFIVKPAPRPKVLKEMKKILSKQTRGNERIRKQLEIRFTCGGNSFVSQTLDLSSDGVHLAPGANAATHARDVPSVGSGIVLEFHLAHKDKVFQITGKVVRHTSEGFGVKFDELSKTAARALDKFLLEFSMEHRASQYYL